MARGVRDERVTVLRIGGTHMAKGFSFASVILSYFLVGGGMFTATLVAGQLHLDSEYLWYAVLAAGAFVGGFIAARASRGSTIVEPAIGAVAVVGTIVALAAKTPLGQTLWAFAQDQTMRFVGSVGVSGIAGALIGATISEKLFGESTRSSIPWLLYSALSTFGACLLVTLFAALVLLSGEADKLDPGVVILIGLAAGCLIAGLAIGASSRVRPLIAALLGGGLGVAGFYALIAGATPSERDQAGIAILAVGGGIITLIGTAVGWAVVGRRYETHPSAGVGRLGPR
jgi:hypothetical protein